MASPAVTYTFTNATTADGTQVSTNFTDLINGMTDGTKDFSINAITCAGAATLNGNVTLGNATGDDITIGGSIAASIPVKTNTSFDLGTSTLGMRSIYIGGSSTFTIRILGPTLASSWTLTLPTTTGSSGNVLQSDGSGVTSWRAITAPTIQKFTSGTGTYTTPSNPAPLYLKVRMVGGGGGGGATTTGTGGTGGNSTFGPSGNTGMLTCNGGTGGAPPNGDPGQGGSASISSPAYGTAQKGNPGSGGHSGVNAASGGGASPFGGAGGFSPTNGGYAGNTNSGSGGAGGSTNGAGNAGGGGGSGGYVDAIVPNPVSSYSYAVGAAGTAGSGSGNTGGAGGSGYIEVVEYYQ